MKIAKAELFTSESGAIPTFDDSWKPIELVESLGESVKTKVSHTLTGCQPGYVYQAKKGGETYYGVADLSGRCELVL